MSALQTRLHQLRSVLKPPPKLSLSEWSEAHYRLSPENSAEAGAFKVGRCEYQREILDACGDARNSEIVICSSSQIGKSTVLICVLLFYIQNDPAPILFIQPSLDNARAFSKDRLAPAIRDSIGFSGLLSDSNKRDGDNNTLSKRYPGGNLNLIGSNSPSSLASRPIRVVLADEIDRYSVSAGDEGNPLALAVKRTFTFHNRKLIFVSTPVDEETSQIWARYQTSDRRKFHIRCTHCGDHFEPLFEHVRWTKSESGDHQPENALLHCPHCGGGMTDPERNQAIKAGKWIAENPGASTIGFHVSALHSPFARLSEIATEFLACRNDVLRLKVFRNTVLGLPWKSAVSDVSDLNLINRVEQFDSSSIPNDVSILVAGCDVQGDRIECTLLGIGSENRKYVVEHRVFSGSPSHPATWMALREHLLSSFNREDGTPLRILATAIDSGGNHTAEVYKFTLDNAKHRFYAIKGRQGSLPIWPKRRSQSEKGRVWLLGVDSAKTSIYSWLKETDSEHPAFIHFSDSLDADYFTQLTVERRELKHRNGHSFWVWTKKEADRNEALDCFVYGLAAFESTGLNAERMQQRLQKVRDRQTSIPADVTEDIEPIAPTGPRRPTIGPRTGPRVW